MRYLILPFLCLAALALGVAVVANLAALLAHQVLLTRGTLSALFISIFICGIPMIFCFNLAYAQHPELRGRSPGAWTLLLSGCPRWVYRLCFGLVAYALIVSLLGVALDPQPPEVRSPATRTLTVAQTRNMSAGPIIFYGMMFPVMLSLFRRPELMHGSNAKRTVTQ